MVFFFILLVVGIMDVVFEIMLNYIFFFVVIIIGICIVVLFLGYIVEKMFVKYKYCKGVDVYEWLCVSFINDFVDCCFILFC